MLSKPPTCLGCPAYELGIGYVPPRGPAITPLAIIGQGPGHQEAIGGKPFIGPSGQALSNWLHKAGILEATVLIDNIVRCQLIVTKPNGQPVLGQNGRPQNRTPSAKEMDYCWPRHGLPRLREAFASIPEGRRCVVPCGVPAMTAILPIKGRATLAGSVFDIDL